MYTWLWGQVFQHFPVSILGTWFLTTHCQLVHLNSETCICFLAELVCWIVTAERQTARIRSLYLKAILRQDVGFFDKEINTGEIVERMSVDTVIIQNAIGEKVISAMTKMTEIIRVTVHVSILK